MDTWLRGAMDTAMAGSLAASVVWRLANADAWPHWHSESWEDGYKDFSDAYKLGYLGSVVNLRSRMLGWRGSMCCWNFHFVNGWMDRLLGLRGTTS